MLAVVVSIAVTGAAGCGLRQVELVAHDVVRLTKDNAPIEEGSDGVRSISFNPKLSGQNHTFPYDRLLWHFTRLPVVRTSSGCHVLLDTGIDYPADVTLDIVEREGYPAHLGEPLDFAYIKELDLGLIRVEDVAALVWKRQWQFRLMWVPVYRLSGYVLGAPLLSRARFLAFDNAARQVTVGLTSFDPADESTWDEYDLEMRDRCPWVSLEIAGVETELLADSGGGPNLILNREQWTPIRERVEILSCRLDSYPTWNGFQEVDAYRLRTLSIGSTVLDRPVVWVRRNSDAKDSPTLGLGVFQDATVVFDFEHRLLLIGRRAQ